MKAVDAIIELVSMETGVPAEDIRSHKRTRKVSYARMAAMRLAYETCGAPIVDLAKAFKRDHTSLAYAAGRCARRKPPPQNELIEKLRPRVREVIGTGAPDVEVPIPQDSATGPQGIVDLIYRQMAKQGYKYYQIEDAVGLNRRYLARYQTQNNRFPTRRSSQLDIAVAEKICRHLGFKLQAVPLGSSKDSTPVTTRFPDSGMQGKPACGQLSQAVVSR